MPERATVFPCPMCGHVSTESDLVTIDHPGEWEEAVSQDEVAEELGVSPDLVGPLYLRAVRVETVGCKACVREPVRVIVH